MELTKKEIETLLEALDSWNIAETYKKMFSDVMTLVSIPDKEERHNFVKKLSSEVLENIAERKMRDETTTMLKAKLILIKQNAKEEDIFTTYNRKNNDKLSEN